MVFNVSGNVKSNAKVPLSDVDSEAQWETGSTEAMLRVKSRNHKRNTACCIVIPWMLVIICLLLMGGIGSWGWGEHFKLQKLQDEQKQKAKLEELVPMNDVIPIDGIEPDQSPNTDEPALPNEDPIPYNDVIVLDEEPVIEIDQEIDISIIETPEDNGGENTVDDSINENSEIFPENSDNSLENGGKNTTENTGNSEQLSDEVDEFRAMEGSENIVNPIDSIDAGKNKNREESEDADNTELSEPVILDNVMPGLQISPFNPNLPQNEGPFLPSFLLTDDFGTDGITPDEKDFVPSIIIDPNTDFKSGPVTLEDDVTNENNVDADPADLSDDVKEVLDPEPIFDSFSQPVNGLTSDINEKSEVADPEAILADTVDTVKETSE